MVVSLWLTPFARHLLGSSVLFCYVLQVVLLLSVYFPLLLLLLLLLAFLYTSEPHHAGEGKSKYTVHKNIREPAEQDATPLLEARRRVHRQRFWFRILWRSASESSAEATSYPLYVRLSPVMLHWRATRSPCFSMKGTMRLATLASGTCTFGYGLNTVLALRRTESPRPFDIGILQQVYSCVRNGLVVRYRKIYAQLERVLRRCIFGTSLLCPMGLLRGNRWPMKGSETCNTCRST
eukprot:scaffold1228_cov246-Pinguiococcus_pyrenoidosus.AAC.22